MSRLLGCMVLLVVLLLNTSGLQAADGKALFTAKCGQCHGNRIAKIDPAMYTAEQWQRFFDKNRHAMFCDLASRFTPEELKAIQAYLMNPSAAAAPPAAASNPPAQK